MSKEIITLGKNACCIPGFESFDTTSIAKRLRRKRHVKSIKELKYEKARKDRRISFTD